jgi:hypothetical protein
MAAIAGDLRAIVVTATSPDGRIEGRAESLEHVSLRFLHDSYDQYYRHRDAESLAHQLGRGATLMATAYQKARRAVMLTHGFERYSVLRPPFSSRHREYLERGPEITAHGASPGREIQVTAVGLTDFRVNIAPDVLDRHEERAFLQLATSAMNDLRADHRRAHAALRHELYLKYKERQW